MTGTGTKVRAKVDPFHVFRRPIHFLDKFTVSIFPMSLFEKYLHQRARGRNYGVLGFAVSFISTYRHVCTLYFGHSPQKAHCLLMQMTDY